MRVSNEPAFILHQRPYLETSLLLDVLTQNFGRVSLVAKGARRSGKGRIPMQSFTPMLMNFSGKRELKSLGSVELHGRSLLSTGDLYINGFYLNELLTRVLPHEDSLPSVFDAYYRVLVELEEKRPPEIVLRYFEFELLRALGYGVQTDMDAEQDAPLQQHLVYRYSNNKGFIAVAGEKTADCFLGASLLAFHQQALSTPEQVRDIRRLCRLALQPLLGGRPLKSRELGRALYQLEDQGRAEKSV